LSEEKDQLSRSTKKLKRLGDTVSEIDTTIGWDLTAPRAPDVGKEGHSETEMGRRISYQETLPRNNPNLTFETRDNPIWMEEDRDDASDDGKPVEDEDRLCPTMLLTAAKKKILREPWRNALIICMFD